MSDGVWGGTLLDEYALHAFDASSVPMAVAGMSVTHGRKALASHVFWLLVRPW